MHPLLVFPFPKNVLTDCVSLRPALFNTETTQPIPLDP